MLDVAIVGGGVAGLWIFQRLLRLGYRCEVFDNAPLGTGQSIAAQGIIHSGLKYGVSGLFKPTLRAMPERWTRCMMGSSEVDLTGLRVLARRQDVFNASRSVHFSLHDAVIDMRDLLTRLSVYANPKPWTPEVEARATIFTAGIGNEQFCQFAGVEPTKMVRRPLRMFMARGFHEPFFGHVLGLSSKPLVTVTSHRMGDEWVWYLGGQIAEQDDLGFACEEMERLFPEHEWYLRQWAWHDVDRAEPAGHSIDRPKLVTNGNCAMAWPCKMTLAPALGDLVVEWLEKTSSKGVYPDRMNFFKPEPAPIARLPWESANWQAPPA